MLSRRFVSYRCNYIRGHPDDFDAWGLPSWSFSELIGYFRRSERLETAALRDQDRQSASFTPIRHLGSPQRLGHTGGAADRSIAVGETRAPHAISTGFVAAAARFLGRQACGPLLQAPDEGAGLNCVTVSDGVRASNAAALRTTAATAAVREGRLVVLTHTKVLQLLIGDPTSASQALPRARGVRVRCANGEVRVLGATREVVLCAGAINTPQLLLLSGVGPESELRELGITTLLDSPHVGKHLRDTAAVGLAARTGLATLDKQLRTPWPYLR
jgi:choline dehydrogenase-like flavoprotein